MNAREDLATMLKELRDTVSKREEDIRQEQEQNRQDNAVIVVLENSIKALDEALGEEISRHEEEMFEFREKCKAAFLHVSTQIAKKRASLDECSKIYSELFLEDLPDPYESDFIDSGPPDEIEVELPAAATG